MDHVFTHNLKSKDVKKWQKELLQNEAFRRQQRTHQNYLYHTIISFAKEDKTKISPETLKDIGKQYISLRGEQGMFVGNIHEDKDNLHIHLLESGLEFRTGKSFWQTKQAFQTLKQDLELYQRKKYPELTKSIVQHGKGKQYVTDREWHFLKNAERSSHKQKIKEKIKTCFEQSKSQQDFLDRLRSENIPHYERNGIPQGIIFEDMKFRFSRLDFSKDQFNELPKDMSQEERAMDEIRNIRESRTDKSKDKDEKEQDNGRDEIEDEELSR